METKILTTGYTQMLKKAVDVYDRQHQAIAKNVANSNNDNYRRVNTDFSSELKTAVENSGVRTTRDKHIKRGTFEQGPGNPKNMSPDEQVDMAREMTDLSINQIRHEFATRALSKHYAGITKAIIGRNR